MRLSVKNYRKSKLGIECGKSDRLPSGEYWVARSHRRLVHAYIQTIWNYLTTNKLVSVHVCVIRQPCIGARTAVANHSHPADGSDISQERARAGSSSAGGRVHGVLHETESWSHPHAVVELSPEEGKLKESGQELHIRSRGKFFLALKFSRDALHSSL